VSAQSIVGHQSECAFVRAFMRGVSAECNCADVVAWRTCPTCENDGTVARPLDGNCPAEWAHQFLGYPRRKVLA
jgi:hypothetical protein